MNSSAKGKKKRLNLKNLKNKKILLGVSGGIAAGKSVDLARRLLEEGASVSVIMTEAARNFVTPLSLEIASGNRVLTSLFDEPMAHISLSSTADLMVVAPATANILGKLANGIADDLLSTCFLSFNGKVIVAPSMNWRMYENRIFQENLRKLTSSGVMQVGPERGSLACGEEGIGRMAEVADIVDAVKAVVSIKDLAGEKIIVTAGPTREYLDPVRFISNRSSGKMGFSLAKAARNRGADVTLISGPSLLERPRGMDFLQVETSREMLQAVGDKVRQGATVLIMAAAVADFTPISKSDAKIEKGSGMQLALSPVPDIISSISSLTARPFIIGFAAETGGDTGRAKEKMKKKKMDMIVFNDVTEAGSGFDVDTNRVVIIDRQGELMLDTMTKDSVADAIFDRFLKIKS